MAGRIFRYTFNESVDMSSIESTMLLGILACEALHGEARVRLEAGHTVDPLGRVCVIDAGTKVGEDLSRLFTGFVRQEFGEAAFTVQSVEPDTGVTP